MKSGDDDMNHERLTPDSLQTLMAPSGYTDFHVANEQEPTT